MDEVEDSRTMKSLLFSETDYDEYEGFLILAI
jgi:hypothetical protein